MLKRIPQRLGCDPVDLIPDDGMQRPYGSLRSNSKRSRVTCGRIRREFLAERSDGGLEVIWLLCRAAQSLHSLPPLGNRISRLTDRDAEDFFGLGRPRQKKIPNCLELQQQALEAL